MTSSEEEHGHQPTLVADIVRIGVLPVLEGLAAAHATVGVVAGRRLFRRSGR